MFPHKTEFTRIDPGFGSLESGSIEVAETDSLGKASVTVQLDGECAIFKGDHKHILWITNRNFADKTIISYKGRRLFLHIFELKRTVDVNSWSGIKQQAEGSIINAYAVRGVLEMPPYHETILYVGYRRDKLTERVKASPVSTKFALGTRQSLVPESDWTIGKTFLLDGRKAKIVKIQLDDQGTATISI